jgi:signal transduction histidine kinase
MNMNISRRWTKGLSLLPALVVFALIVITGTVVSASAHDGVTWTPDGRVIGLTADGPAERAGLEFGDVILSVDTCSLPQWHNCERLFYHPGQVLQVVFQRGEQVHTTSAKTASLSPGKRAGLLPILLASLASCLLSTIVLLNRPEATETRLFYAMGQIGAAAIVAVILESRFHLASRAYNLLFSLLSPVMVHFHAVFPQRRWLARRPVILLALYSAGTALGVVWPLHPVIHNLWMLVGFGTAIGLMVAAYLAAPFPRDRRHIRLIVLGTVLGFAPIGLLTVAPAALFSVQWVPLRFTLPVLIAVPATYAIALWRYHLMGLERMLNRGVVYLLLSPAFFGLYFALLALTHVLLPDDASGRVVSGTAVGLIAALTFHPLRDAVQRLVDRLFYGGWYDYRGLVEEISQSLAHTLDAEELAEVLVRQVPKAMHLPGAALWSEREGQMEVMSASDPAFADQLTRVLTMWTDLDEVRLSGDRAVVPLTVEQQTIGVWVLAGRAGEEWSPEDQRILTVLRRQAALSAQNVRLVATLRAKVTEVEGMHRKLVTAGEQERAELAQELHDGVIQDLIDLRYRLDSLQEGTDSGQAEEKAGPLDEIYDQTGILVDELRRLCSGLRPPALDQLGLAAALRALAREMIARGLPVETCLEDIALPDEAAIGLYRIAQEALSNAWRHAEATQAYLKLARAGDRVELAVADNGIGFDPTAARKADGRFGLLGMSERAEALGGRL